MFNAAPEPTPDTLETKCWQCKKTVKSTALFCNACDALQPPKAMDHFARFGVEKNFKLEQATLEEAYIALQRQLHPDRFARRSDTEKRFSTSHTLEINEGYAILKSPLKRAEYLLALAGIEVNKDTRTSVKASKELLMESMEAREALAQAMTFEAFSSLKRQNQAHQKECISALASAFKDARLDDAAQSTIRLKYLEKLGEEIKMKKPSF